MGGCRYYSVWPVNVELFKRYIHTIHIYNIVCYSCGGTRSTSFTIAGRLSSIIENNIQPASPATLEERWFPVVDIH